MEDSMAMTVRNLSLFPIDRNALRGSVAGAAQRFSDMLRLSHHTAAIADPSGGWGVGEHAAHTFMAQQLFAGVVDGVPWDYAGNEPALVEFRERDGAVLAEGIVGQTKSLLAATRRNDGQQRVHGWFGPMTMPGGESYSLVHLEMHAVPVARALG